jgi:hypothetical protein
MTVRIGPEINAVTAADARDGRSGPKGSALNRRRRSGRSAAAPSYPPTGGVLLTEPSVVVEFERMLASSTPQCG